MNLDLIRKLERIAHDKMWNANVDSDDFPNSFNVEFAELIVRECLIEIERLGIRNGDTEHNRALNAAWSAISEKFGGVKTYD